MNKEKLKLSSEESRDIIFGDSDDYKVIQDTISSTSRWSILHEIIIMRISDSKLFRSGYSIGATEQQDERPFQYEETNIWNEVSKVEKTIICYE